MILQDLRLEATWARLPVKQNLERIGIDMAVRTVDTSQYQRRTDTYDFDMIIDLWGQSSRRATSSASSGAPRPPTSRADATRWGIKDAAIDQLIELMVAAPDRESLVTRTRCLDRVLSWHQFIIPQFYSNKELFAYWNRFGRPAKNAKYSRGATDTWWVDEAKDKALKRGGNEEKK